MELDSIEIFLPEKVLLFTVGKKIVLRGEPTDIEIERIYFDMDSAVHVTLSNGKRLNYHNVGVYYESTWDDGSATDVKL